MSMESVSLSLSWNGLHFPRKVYMRPKVICIIAMTAVFFRKAYIHYTESTNH